MQLDTTEKIPLLFTWNVTGCSSGRVKGHYGSSTSCLC